MSREAKAGRAFCGRNCRRRAGTEAAREACARPVGYKRLHEGTGYVHIRTETGWTTEHRVVLAQMLGRPLFDGETAHHKNGDKADNRPENLELWVTKQPKGQRPEDLVEFALEILGRYAGNYQGQRGPTTSRSFQNFRRGLPEVSA